MHSTVDLHGILAAVTTPFTPEAAAIDEDALLAQADRLITAGIHGLVTTGSTGEFSTLTAEEYARVIELYVAAARRRVPVVAGVGALTTGAAVELARFAEETGADAVMLLPPFYGGLDVEALTAFLSTVAKSITIPIVYYNIPATTGVRLTAAQLARLGDIPGVDHLKDTSGDAVALAELLAAHGHRIQAFNGWDTLTFFAIVSGARACVWGAAGIVPKLALDLWNALAVQGDLAQARDLWTHLWAISDFLESVNYVAGIKTGLEIVGHPVGPPRLPVQPLDVASRTRFTEILRAAGQVP